MSVQPFPFTLDEVPDIAHIILQGCNLHFRGLVVEGVTTNMSDEVFNSRAKQIAAMETTTFFAGVSMGLNHHLDEIDEWADEEVIDAIIKEITNGAHVMIEGLVSEFMEGVK